MTDFRRSPRSAPGEEERAHAGAPPRVTDHLANERTFLAWVRTSIAIVGLGFVMARFSIWLRQLPVVVDPALRMPKPGVSLPAGIALILFGALIAALSYKRYRTVERAIDGGRFVPARGLLVMMTAAVVIVSLAVVVYLAATTRL